MSKIKFEKRPPRKKGQKSEMYFTSIRFPLKLARKVEAVAGDHDISFSEVVNQTLEQTILGMETKTRPTLEASIGASKDYKKDTKKVAKKSEKKAKAKGEVKAKSTETSSKPAKEKPAKKEQPAKASKKASEDDDLVDEEAA